ncbi:MAG: orotidine-5'-phosphate decarboxylase [Devosiaceae bacterium]|nr:orotidine-5'-phosphate decarboxylase [Devosiaceae bacterium MH13]
MQLATARDRLAIALDVTGVDAARRLLDLVGDEVGVIKIGHQLAYSGGFGLIEELSRAGKAVFADLKLLDIDQTVAQGARSVAQTGATFLTIHAYPKAMRAAVAALGGDTQLNLLGVTVLTSMDGTDLTEAGYANTASALVRLRAVQAREAGMPGLVCSPQEAGALRALLGPDKFLVTPGIRFDDGDSVGSGDDQKRVATPDWAIAQGADILVMGRPITAAADPVSAARRAVDAIEAGLAARSGAQ